MNRWCKAIAALAFVLVFTALTVPAMVSAAQQTDIETIHTEFVNPVYGQDIQLETASQAPVFYADPDRYHADIEDAAEELREELEERDTTVTIGLKTKLNPNETPLSEMIFEKALAHTGAPTQGDYLKWQFKEWECSISGRYNSREETYTLNFAYRISYYTSAQQEKALDLEIKKLLDQLNVYTANDYEKVCAIYDYMCENIAYDTAGLSAKDSDLIYTAYAALINKTCVCQGYSNLFYRLALELGVDSRIITGIGNGGGHAWNIVELDGKYYDLDATWDAKYAQLGREYQYFLKCDADFGDHQRADEYTAETFTAAYPMDTENYTYSEQTVTPGEFDSKDGVTDSDAVYLLRFTLFPEEYPVADYSAADVNNDGSVTDADAVYLLRFTLFPTDYPLYPRR